MSDTKTTEGEAKTPTPVFKKEELMHFLAWDINHLESRLKGDIFTYIDSLGYNDRQTKAVKDVIRRIIQESLMSFGEQVQSSIVTRLETIGYKKSDPNLKEDSLFNDLRYYKHWDTAGMINSTVSVSD